MKQRDFNKLGRYFSSPSKSLYDCYKAPSKIKVSIYEDIKRQCYDDKGHDLKIISANSHAFSCGYLLDIDGEEYLKYFTKSETQLIPTKKFWEAIDNANFS